MVNEMTNDEIEELVGLKDYEKNMLKARNNGLLLTDNQVNTLEKYNIDVSKCSTMSELLYMIDQIDDPDDDELTFLAEQLSEFQYYNDTRK
ncbi:MAG TPA: hypothetical protein IAC02_09610 [Candidatus Coprovivens excrementavium]|nr:hypothetical protein [Candidatus Coprovivens excrementavium]